MYDILKWHANISEEKGIFNPLTKIRQDQLMERVLVYSWFHGPAALYQWTVTSHISTTLKKKTVEGGVNDTCAARAEEMSK